jgi:hypothetical protein
LTIDEATPSLSPLTERVGRPVRDDARRAAPAAELAKAATSADPLVPDERTPQSVAFGTRRMDMVDELNLLEAVWTPQGERESKIVDAEVLALVRSMGGDVVDYRQGRAKDIGRIVSDIYSPPRVTAAAKLLPSLRCIPGFALDLTTSDADGKPWDFDILENRVRAKRLVEEQRPALLICTPMCTAFSAWQRINNRRRDPDVVSEEYRRALVHLQFCCDLYLIQKRNNRYFLHEHPQQAASWSEEAVMDILAKSGVEKVLAHQCQFGAVDAAGLPVKKPTCFMTKLRGDPGRARQDLCWEQWLLQSPSWSETC